MILLSVITTVMGLFIMISLLFVLLFMTYFPHIFKVRPALLPTIRMQSVLVVEHCMYTAIVYAS